MRAFVGAVGTVLLLVSFAGLALLAASPTLEPSGSPPAAPTESSPPQLGSMLGAAAPDATAAGAAAVAAPVLGAVPVLFDEHFTDNRMGWPDHAEATAGFGPGGYRLAPGEPGHFVAVGAPISAWLHDVVVSATFRKVGGPPGGGYGLIVRDQSPAERDGLRQDGRYYVLEVGDKGEVGIWRRADDHWVELVPWTASEPVQPGAATNRLEVWAMGARLSLLVNGVQVASQVDDSLAAGGVGVFAGGDGNDVALEDFTVRVPPAPGATGASPPTPASGPAPTTTTTAGAPPATPTAAPFLPITRVRIPRIGLDSEALPAPLVETSGGLTWEVPPFKIGHADGTAGAGGPGNAVLVGHVTSRSLGNVFANLQRVQVGDGVQLFSGEQRFDYQVAEARTVLRTDLSVVRPTPQPAVTLITCTGTWLPLISDYDERFVVRAALAQPLP